MRKSLYDTSWQVDEPTYRANDAISYSTLSKFAREGYRCIPNLKDNITTEPLRFGSLVDCLMTEPETLEKRFLFGDLPSLSDVMIKIVTALFERYGADYRNINTIPEHYMLGVIDMCDYGGSWKNETRINKVIEACSEYYNLLALLNGRILMPTLEYQRAVNCVTILKTHSYTKDYFEEEMFNENIEKLYQLKFLLDDDSVIHPVRCMFDLIIVDHKNKTIKPCDLKTTSKNEDSFQDSFIKWRYDLQATLYSFILQRIIEKDEYFKDFILLSFDFIVINKYNLTPLVWEYKDNLIQGDRIDNFGNIYKSWQNLLSELTWHLNHQNFIYPKKAVENNGLMTLDNLKIKENDSIGVF